MPTNSEHALTVLAKFNANNMLTVASVAARATSVGVRGNGVIEHVYKTPVVRRDNERAIGGASQVVDVSVVLTFWFAAGNIIIALLDGVRSPFQLGGCRHAVGVLMLSLHAIEETFVATVTGANVSSVERPVETINEGGVARKLAEHTVFAFLANLVDMNAIVVRANCKVLLIGGESSNFAPLLGFLQALEFFVEIIDISNTDFTKVAAQDNVAMLCVIGDAAGLFVRRELTHACGCALAGALRFLDI